MKKLIVAILAFPLLLGSFISSEEKGFEIGDKAPLVAHEMKDLRGNLLSLKKSVSKSGLVIVFSCNTCPFVVGSQEFKGWERQYNELADFAEENGFGFILVNANEAKRDNDDSMEAMQKRATEKKYKMPYLLDSNSTLANAFGAKTTPHVFVLNANFELTYKGSIDNSWDTKRMKDIAYLKTAISEMAAGNKITTPETAPKGCSIKRI